MLTNFHGPFQLLELRPDCRSLLLLRIRWVQYRRCWWTRSWRGFRKGTGTKWNQVIDAIVNTKKLDSFSCEIINFVIIKRANFQRRDVAEIISHEDFDYSTISNDVCLLRLAEPFELNE